MPQEVEIISTADGGVSERWAPVQIQPASLSPIQTPFQSQVLDLAPLINNQPR